ncbi:MAG: 50S ribosomal protein L17 [Lentisphaeria bacterium]|nr:50S ribosomal protein L17 [Lentisphaeria bacterium]
MRHLRNISKLGRNCGHRKAMLVNLACSLLEHGQIKTTVNRAKETRKMVDALITYAKKGDDHNRRLAAAKMKINTPSDKAQGKKAILDKLFGEIAERFAQRPGGYTRIIRLGHRVGDCAQYCMIQLVEGGAPVSKKKAAPAAEATVEAEAKAE